ncbi:hypothetical protein LCGC14_0246050 [marine sediment metagenome]|uniref:Uncharacterized protein n=1 Tax=marine sediment metagenome TaxID=412755 RepID=A0A0F9UAM7_9ZZZZ
MKNPFTAVKQLIVPPTVEEIHEDFRTEVERLIEDANILHSEETTKGELLTKADALNTYGFFNTPEAKEASKEVKRLSVLQEENRNKELLREAIYHFSSNYPNYKFITESSVKELCKKYGLIYGTVNYFIGDVPDVNLKHLQEFIVAEGDECHMSYSKYNDGTPFNLKYLTKKEVEREKDMRRVFSDIKFIQCPLEIVAPSSDFNLKGMDITDFEIRPTPIEDPIVLHPVYWKGTKHYLIGTAWGPEASDPLAINEKMN